MSKKTIGFAEQQGGLYFLKAATLVSYVPSDSFLHTVNLTSKDVSMETWHTRLGHISYKNLSHIKNIGVSCKDMNKVCEICPLAKQKRASFPISTSISSACFDMIHCDIWGPFSIESHGGFKYFFLP